MPPGRRLHSGADEDAQAPAVLPCPDSITTWHTYDDIQSSGETLRAAAVSVQLMPHDTQAGPAPLPHASLAETIPLPPSFVPSDGACDAHLRQACPCLL